jgi:hypothetical protein
VRSEKLERRRKEGGRGKLEVKKQKGEGRSEKLEVRSEDQARMSEMMLP